MLPAWRMHEAYAHELVCDLTDEQMDAVPGPGHENTPRFTIGHLCVGSALTRRVLEHPNSADLGSLDVPAMIQSNFGRMGPADRRLPETVPDAPSADELLAEFRRQHDELERTLRDVDDAVLESPCGWKLGHLMPRHADLITFVCSHEMLHLGQLASWRRAMGLEAAMARMAAPTGIADRTDN